VQRLTTVRYWAALKDAAGTADDQVEAGTLAEALAEVRARHDDRFSAVLARCSLLVDGAQVGHRHPAEVTLPGGGEVDCLPPFAGG
jgi:molybdopterin converting factor small subunit